MSMKTSTEKKLIDALDSLVSGKSKYTNGALTQNNLCTEAGVSRTTLNRYKNILEDFNRAKNFGRREESKYHPVSIQEKNKELMEENSRLRRKNQKLKESYEKELAKARQKIYVQSRRIEAQEKKNSIKSVK